MSDTTLREDASKSVVLGTGSSPYPETADCTSIWSLLDTRADLNPDAVAAFDERGRTLTYGEWRDWSLRVAAGLAERGIGRGSVVSWQLPSWLEAMTVFMALSRLGAVQNPLIMMLRDKEVRFITMQAKTELVILPRDFRNFAHGEMADRLVAENPGLQVLLTDDGLPEGDPTSLEAVSDEPEVRWLFYTSGTTSDPKGAMHTDAGLLAAATTYCNAIHPEPDDRIAALAPMAHVGGVLHVLSAVQAGCSVVLADIFDPVNTTRVLSELDVTIGGSGAPFARMLIDQQRANPEQRLFTRQKSFMHGGSPFPESLHYEVKEVLGGVGMVSGYGLTECPYVSWGTLEDTDDQHARCEGPPGPGTEVRIVSPEGTVVPRGESGELRVKARQLMKGYVDSSLDVAAFDEDGFFRTGDLASVDEDGYVRITGRLKDVIIRNMENISAREVEEGLIACEGVKDVTVIGIDDDRTGERVCAVVVPSDPAEPPTLESLTSQLLAQGLNKRKLPEALQIVEVLPRNAMGKILKRELKDRFN